MGFPVDFYRFSKKINSTARPSTADMTKTCTIKDPCGVLNPVIGLNLGLTDSPREYNYAYIATFDRYYYIKEWTFQNALWYASLEVDVLASWKVSIGNSNCYVTRSSDAYNLDIIDSTYPTTKITTVTSDIKTSPWHTASLSEGMYVVGIAGHSTTYYIFYQEALDLFFDYLFSDLYADALCGTWATLYPQLKAQTNPTQYITSIMWYPFQSTATSVDTIRVGWVDVPCVAWKIDGSGVVGGIHDFTLQRHPQAERGRYLNRAPYTKYTLFYPPWGMISLDADILANNSDIHITWFIDFRNGHGTLAVTSGTDDNPIYLTWLHSQIGVAHQVSQVVNKGFGLGNVLSPVASTAFSLAQGKYLSAGATAISGTVSAIGDAVSSMVPTATTIGSDGGINSLRGNPTLSYEFKEIVNEDLSHRGRPLCSNRVINTLTGFIMVSDADISIPSTKTEQDAIRTYMEGGFFYE
jgi:hypothetical protein